MGIFGRSFDRFGNRKYCWYHHVKNDHSTFSSNRYEFVSDKFETFVTLGPLLEPKYLNFATNLISPSPTRSQPYLFQMTLTVILVHFVNLSANVQIHWLDLSKLTPLQHCPGRLWPHFSKHKDCIECVQAWKSPLWTWWNSGKQFQQLFQTKLRI